MFYRIIHCISEAPQCDNKFYYIATHLRRQNLPLVNFAFMFFDCGELYNKHLVNVIMENMKKRGHLKFHKVKTWYLLVFLVPLLFIDATLLRMDHIKMTELRDAVLVADQNDDDEATSRNLEVLKDYVFSNIVINVVDDNGNQKVTFGTGPFYLEHQYIRAANEALERAEETLSGDSNPNGNIYQMASDVCRPQAIANGWTWNDPNYINCMMGEIQKYPAANDLQDTVIAALPSTELYRHNYASPLWAPTFTGFMLLLTLVMIVVILIRFIVWMVLRLSLLFLH